MTEGPVDLRGHWVRCTRCGRGFQNLPHDAYHEPADWLGWNAGGVCYDCLVELAQSYARHNGLRMAARRGITPGILRHKREYR